MPEGVLAGNNTPLVDPNTRCKIVHILVPDDDRGTAPGANLGNLLSFLHIEVFAALNATHVSASIRLASGGVSSFPQ